MSVRTGVGAEARVKRKMVSNAGPSTPSKTPRRTANFDTVALLSPTSCLSCLAVVCVLICNCPSHTTLFLIPARYIASRKSRS
jgi:hypothetical protein